MLKVIAARKSDVLFFYTRIFSAIHGPKFINCAHRFFFMVKTQKRTAIGQHATMPATIAFTFAIIRDGQHTRDRALELLPPGVFAF